MYRQCRHQESAQPPQLCLGAAAELRGSTVLQILGNSSAVQALIKAYSPSAASAPLLGWVAVLGVASGVRPMVRPRADGAKP